MMLAAWTAPFPPTTHSPASSRSSSKHSLQPLSTAVLGVYVLGIFFARLDVVIVRTNRPYE